LPSEPGCLRLPKPLARTGGEPLGSTEIVIQFVESSSVLGSSFTTSIAAADVDGDGDLDVLLGNQGSPSRVLLNAGNGSFPTSIELPGGNATTSSIAAADVDGDGDLDVLLGNSGSFSCVLLNAGGGTFPTSIDLPGVRAFTYSPGEQGMQPVPVAEWRLPTGQRVHRVAPRTRSLPSVQAAHAPEPESSWLCSSHS